MRTLISKICLPAVFAALAGLPVHSRTIEETGPVPASAASSAEGDGSVPAASDGAPVAAEEEAPAVYRPRPSRLADTERELAAEAESAHDGEAALIETSHPYLLPRLFTLPTAYSLQSYEVRFGGQGNIHATVADMDNEAIKGTVSIGLGGIMELGYQLDEYYTVENISDKILMGYFKLSLLKESRYVPALSISASKNLRSTFRSTDLVYEMDEDMYEVVLSKGFRFGDNQVTFHPGLQILRDEVASVRGAAAFAEPAQATKFNPRLGLSWQSRPKTLFMYELKMLSPTELATLRSGSIATHRAVENNLGIRYYIRNWICIDSGIRHFYDLDSGDDEMKLHANFVGVVPLASVYERIENYFRK